MSTYGQSYGGYGQQGGSSYSFRHDPNGIALAAKVLLACSIVVSVVSISSSALQLQLLSRMEAQVNDGLAMFAADDLVTDEEIDSNDTREQMIAIVGLLMLLLTAIFFLIWVYRVNSNCDGFGAQGMNFSSGWAVGCFFVPILNLWKPYQAMKEVSQISNNPVDWESGNASAIVGVWWFLWIGGNILGSVSARLYFNAETIPELQASTMMDAVSEGISIIAAIAAIALVSIITGQQKRLVGGAGADPYGSSPGQRSY